MHAWSSQMIQTERYQQPEQKSLNRKFKFLIQQHTKVFKSQINIVTFEHMALDKHSNIGQHITNK